LHLEQGMSAASGRRAMRMAAAAGWAACVAMVAGVGLVGCGNTYRPVVATIGVVGPAGQPQKYAVVISTPTPPGAPCPGAGQPTSNGLMTMVDFSGDTVLVTAQLGVNPYYLYLNSVGTVGYTLNCDQSLNTFPLTTTLIASQILHSTLPTGSSPVSIVATQQSEYVADPGVNAILQLYSTPPALKQTVPITSGYSPIYVVSQGNPARIYALSQATNGGPGEAVAIETTGNTISATLPVGSGPVYGVMTADTRRVFVLNQTDGTVSVINSQTNMLDRFGPSITGFSIAGNVVTFTAQNTLQAGTSVTISGLTAATYLNGQTLTVLPAGLSSTQFEAAFTHANVASTADSGTAIITDSTIPVGVRPVWADFAPGLNELVVANEGTGTTPGSVSLINIPLCSATALPTNPNCDTTNPIDASVFGQTLATVPVGINPIMVTVLSDNTRAYVANAGTGTLPCSGTISPVFAGGVQTAEACTVSVVNLNTDTVTTTIPINGHPVYIASSNSTPKGKVYVVCKDSQVMTIIRTDTDALYTTVPLQGYGVSVRTSAP
jgi:DNA-binding beta-propeller fold protein YncE